MKINSSTRGAILLCAALLLPATASAEVSRQTLDSLGVPDRVETRIGTLEYWNGAPTEATASKVYDALDFTRALNVYNNTFRAASAYAIVKGFQSIGAPDNTVVIFPEL